MVLAGRIYAALSGGPIHEAAHFFVVGCQPDCRACGHVHGEQGQHASFHNLIPCHLSAQQLNGLLAGALVNALDCLPQVLVNIAGAAFHVRGILPYLLHKGIPANAKGRHPAHDVGRAKVVHGREQGGGLQQGRLEIPAKAPGDKVGARLLRCNAEGVHGRAIFQHDILEIWPDGVILCLAKGCRVGLRPLRRLRNPVGKAHSFCQFNEAGHIVEVAHDHASGEHQGEAAATVCAALCKPLPCRRNRIYCFPTGKGILLFISTGHFFGELRIIHGRIITAGQGDGLAAKGKREFPRLDSTGLESVQPFMRCPNVRPLCMQGVPNFLNVPPVLCRQKAFLPLSCPVFENKARGIVAQQLGQNFRLQVGEALTQTCCVALVAQVQGHGNDIVRCPVVTRNLAH